MTCRDFESAWNARLDARGADAPLSPEAEAHAASCSACRVLASRYQALELALRVWGPPPPPSAGFADRVLNRSSQRISGTPSMGVLGGGVEADTPMLGVPRSVWRPALGWAMAAAVLVATGLTIWTVRPRSKPTPLGEPVAARSLSDSLADATSATLALARSTSAPAARLGRRVLDSASVPEPDWPTGQGVEVVSSREVLQAVGDRVGARTRPLSGSARHAFRFLIPTARTDRPSEPGV